MLWNVCNGSYTSRLCLLIAWCKLLKYQYQCKKSGFSLFKDYIKCHLVKGGPNGGMGGGQFGSGYGGGYGGGAMKNTGYSQRAAGPYGGVYCIIYLVD